MNVGRESEPVLAVSELTAGYRRQPIVFDVAAEFYAGRITAVLGPNGAGKSTLLKAIFGLIHIFDGRIRLRGEATSFDPAALVRAGLAYVPQQRNIFPTLSVRENLEVGGYARKQTAMDQVLELFPVLGTVLKRPAGKLSVGQRNMLAVGRALMSEPSVLLLDEATGGLAPRVAEDLWEHTARLAGMGNLAIIVVEQNVDLALKYSDDAYLLSSGRVLLAGSAADLRSRPDFEQLFIGVEVDETGGDPAEVQEAVGRSRP